MIFPVYSPLFRSRFGELAYSSRHLASMAACASERSMSSSINLSHLSPTNRSHRGKSRERTTRAPVYIVPYTLLIRIAIASCDPLRQSTFLAVLSDRFPYIGETYRAMNSSTSARSRRIPSDASLTLDSILVILLNAFLAFATAYNM